MRLIKLPNDPESPGCLAEGHSSQQSLGGGDSPKVELPASCRGDTGTELPESSSGWSGLPGDATPQVTQVPYHFTKPDVPAVVSLVCGRCST